MLSCNLNGKAILAIFLHIAFHDFHVLKCPRLWHIWSWKSTQTEYLHPNDRTNSLQMFTKIYFHPKLLWTLDVAIHFFLLHLWSAPGTKTMSNTATRYAYIITDHFTTYWTISTSTNWLGIFNMHAFLQFILDNMVGTNIYNDKYPPILCSKSIEFHNTPMTSILLRLIQWQHQLQRIGSDYISYESLIMYRTSPSSLEL